MVNCQNVLPCDIQFLVQDIITQIWIQQHLILLSTHDFNISSIISKLLKPIQILLKVGKNEFNLFDWCFGGLFWIFYSHFFFLVFLSSFCWIRYITTWITTWIIFWFIFSIIHLQKWGIYIRIDFLSYFRIILLFNYRCFLNFSIILLFDLREFLNFILLFGRKWVIRNMGMMMGFDTCLQETL